MTPERSVRDLMLQRLAEGSRPGERSDPYKLVLAVEGGGMRGAVSSGMLLALEQLGFRNAFDEVVGTSAGAIAGAFFVIGEGTKGSVLYYTVLNSEKFVDRRRLFRSSAPILDLDYLIDHAFERHGFSWAALIASDVPLFATVSPVHPRNPRRLFRVGESEERARRVLAATANLPVIAGPSRFVGSDEYVDGGMLEPVPWLSAIERGATHVLVTRSRRFIEGGPEQPNVFERTTVPRLVRRMHGEYIASLVDESPERFWYNTESLRAILEGRALPASTEGRPVVLEAVLPAPTMPLPDRLEIDTHILMDALTDGAQAMVDFMKLEGFKVEQRVVVTHPRAPIGRVRSDALAPIVMTRRQMPRG